MESVVRPKDDHLILRAMSAFTRDGGEPTPSMMESNVLEYGDRLFVELRCEQGSLLSLYRFNQNSGRLRKQ